MGEDVGLGPLDTGLEVGKVGHADVLGPPLESEAIVVVEVFFSFFKSPQEMFYCNFRKNVP